MTCFFQYPLDLVNLMLKRKTLCMHEEKLFLLRVKWMHSEFRNVLDTWEKNVPNIMFGRMSVSFFIENGVYKNIISYYFAMKMVLYLNSLNVCKDTVGPAFHSRMCESDKDIKIVRFFSRSPRNTWKCDELNGDRLVVSVDTNMQLHVYIDIMYFLCITRTNQIKECSFMHIVICIHLITVVAVYIVL